ncbi:MAG: hypothetical protein HYR85_03525 [Planctomycetes bacterium]|nr:hypothetical protein [Planctomycetota bacterium]MBI3845911.1 hypothetical protein [Planctomycetota bacterium]
MSDDPVAPHDPPPEIPTRLWQPSARVRKWLVTGTACAAVIVALRLLELSPVVSASLVSWWRFALDGISILPESGVLVAWIYLASGTANDSLRRNAIGAFGTSFVLRLMPGAALGLGEVGPWIALAVLGIGMTLVFRSTLRGRWRKPALVVLAIALVSGVSTAIQAHDATSLLFLLPAVAVSSVVFVSVVGFNFGFVRSLVGARSALGAVAPVVGVAWIGSFVVVVATTVVTVVLERTLNETGIPRSNRPSMWILRAVLVLGEAAPYACTAWLFVSVRRRRGAEVR